MEDILTTGNVSSVDLGDDSVWVNYFFVNYLILIVFNIICIFVNYLILDFALILHLYLFF
jgi:hypothetical protein